MQIINNPRIARMTIAAKFTAAWRAGVKSLENTAPRMWLSAATCAALAPSLRLSSIAYLSIRPGVLTRFPIQPTLERLHTREMRYPRAPISPRSIPGRFPIPHSLRARRIRRSHAMNGAGDVARLDVPISLLSRLRQTYPRGAYGSD